MRSSRSKPDDITEPLLSRRKPDDDTEPLLYRPRRVAIITDQSVSKIYKDIHEGLLETVRLGRSVRIPAAALRRYIRGVA